MNQETWLVHWRTVIGLSQSVPAWLVATMALVFVYSLVILPSGVFVSYVERKLGADLQARVGPNRAGPAGVLQPLADFLKLLQKRPYGALCWKERFWLSVQTMTLYSTVAVLPLGSAVLLVNTDMSAFLPFWAALVLALGTMLLGLDQVSVPGWIGGIRVAAQALAAAFPALIAILCAGLRAGGFQWSSLVEVQGAFPWSWTVFSSLPFGFGAFSVFVMSGLVLLGAAPFDGGLSTPDIHGGVMSRLNGERLGLFRFGRFYGFFLWSLISVVLFLGGWNLPEGVLSAVQQKPQVLQFLESSVVLAKTFLLMFFIVWVARVNPRLRADQITDLTWKVLSPLALLSLLGSALWVGWGSIS